MNKKKLFSIGSILFFLIAFLLSFFQFRHQLSNKLQEDVYRSLSDVSNQHKFFFHCRLEREINILKTLSSCTPTGTEEDNKYIFSMMDQLTESSGFQCFALVSADGTRITNDGHQDNVSDYEVFKQAMKGEWAVSQPMESFVDGEVKKIILMAYPVTDGDKTVRCIFGAYEIDQLSSVLLPSIQGEGFITIINSDGDIIIPEDASEHLSTGINFFDLHKDIGHHGDLSLPQIKQKLMAGDSGYFSYVYNGQTNMAFFEQSGIDGWYILSVAPENVIKSNEAAILSIVNNLTIKTTVIFIIIILVVFIKTKLESRKYKSKSEKDSMTGLYNKTTTEKLIDLTILQDHAQSHALFLFDIDNFKGINDTFGHLTGDNVIKKVAGILNDVFRKDDITGRIGGDEFAALMKNVSDEIIVGQKAQELIQAMQEIILENGKKVTFSIGIAISNPEAKSFVSLYQNADKALYQAKNMGKNQYDIYQKSTSSK